MGVIVAYVAISYYIALVTKTAGVKKKWIPVVSGAAGILCGVVGHIIGMTDGNMLEDIAIGLFSGLSAVGTNEISKYIFVRKE